MSTISFNVIAHDLASRKFRGVGNAALAMAAKIRAANAFIDDGGVITKRSEANFGRMALAMALTGRQADSLSTKLRNFWGGDREKSLDRTQWRLLLTAIAAMPAVAGAAYVAVGALVGGIVSGTPGVIAMGGALAGFARRLREMRAGEREATPALQRANRAFRDLRRSWESFLDKTEGTSSRVFTQGFRGLAELLPRLVPLTNTFSRVFARFIRSVRRDMQTPAFGEALKWLRDVGKVSFNNILQSGRNLVTFLYNLSRSFEQVGVDIRFDWLKNLTKSWSDWADALGDNQRFRRIIAFIKGEWPQIKDVFSNLWDTLANFTEGMEPITSELIDFLEKLTAATARISPERWTQIGKAMIALGIGLKALAIGAAAARSAYWIIALFTALSRLGGGGRGAGGAGQVGRFAGALTRLGTALKSLTIGGAAATILGYIFGKGGYAAGGGVLGGGRMPPILGPVMEQLKKLRGIKPIQIPVILKAGVGAMGGILSELRNKVVRIAFRVNLGALAAAGAMYRVLRNKVVRLAFRVNQGALAVAGAMYRVLRNKVVRVLVRAPRAALGVAVSLYRVLRNKVVRVLVRAPRAALSVAVSLYRVLRNKAVRVLVRVPRAALSVAVSLYRVLRNKAVRVLVRVPRAALSVAVSLYRVLRSKVVRVTMRVNRGGLRIAVALYRTLRNKTVRIVFNIATSALSRAVGLFRSLYNKTVTITQVVRKIVGRATGGPVAKNTPYMVGEVGPELFVPDSSGTIVPNHRLPRGVAREGGDTYIINVTGAVDPIETGRAVQRALLALKRNNGGRSLGLA